MATYKVGYMVGSLATASINRKLAKALIRLAPPELEFVEVPIKDLPLYSYDYDADYPAEGRALKDTLATVDAVLLGSSRSYVQHSPARWPACPRRVAVDQRVVTLTRRLLTRDWHLPGRRGRLERLMGGG